jgi:hypothetical protein
LGPKASGVRGTLSSRPKRGGPGPKRGGDGERRGGGPDRSVANDRVWARSWGTGLRGLPGGKGGREFGPLANGASPLLTSVAGPRASVGNLGAEGPGAASIYRVLSLSWGLSSTCLLLTEPSAGLASFNHAARAGGSGLYELPDRMGADISFAEC